MFASIPVEVPAATEVAWQLMVIALLVVANGYFVAAEFAMVKVRASRVEALAVEGRRGAKSALHVLEHLDVYLSACQLGITLASLGLGWAGEPFVASLLVPLLQLLGLPAIGGGVLTHLVSSGLAFGLITFLHIVVGEMAPKSLGIRHAEAMVMITAPPLIIFHRIFQPFIWSLNGTALWLLHMVGLHNMRDGGGHSEIHTQDDLRVILAASARHGHLGVRGRRMMDRILDFPLKTVRQIMIPRTAMVVLRVESPPADNLRLAVESGHSRFPVVRGEAEEVVGFVLIRDLYEAAGRGELNLLRVMRKALFLSENCRLEQLLAEFQRRKVHMAVIIDEYGATAGLVTLEDVLEEIVGEIQDEGDSETPPVRRLADGVYLVDGLLGLDSFADRLGLDLREFAGRVETVGGMVLDLIGTEPRLGQEAIWNGHRLIVEAIDGRRISKVRFLYLAMNPSPLIAQTLEPCEIGELLIKSPGGGGLPTPPSVVTAHTEGDGRAPEASMRDTKVSESAA